MNDPLVEFAEQLVSAKGLQLEPEARQRIVQDVTIAVEDHIHAEMLGRLSDEQLDAFDREITDDSTAEDTLAFFARNGVDAQDSATVAMERFKQAYLGE